MAWSTKTLIITVAMFFTALPPSLHAQENILKYTPNDLSIIEHAEALLSDSTKWNRRDDRECADDIASGKYSLYCALYKASIEVTGKFDHRSAAMEIVRYTVEKHYSSRVKDHRLMDWNNHSATTFAEVKAVLQEASAKIRRRAMEP